MEYITDSGSTTPEKQQQGDISCDVNPMACASVSSPFTEAVRASTYKLYHIK